MKKCFKSRQKSKWELQSKIARFLSSGSYSVSNLQFVQLAISCFFFYMELKFCIGRCFWCIVYLLLDKNFSNFRVQGGMGIEGTPHKKKTSKLLLPIPPLGGAREARYSGAHLYKSAFSNLQHINCILTSVITKGIYWNSWTLLTMQTVRFSTKGIHVSQVL